MKSYTCVFCGKKFNDWGNNPDCWDGTEWKDEDRCCNDCNEIVVVPARIAKMCGKMIQPEVLANA